MDDTSAMKLCRFG